MEIIIKELESVIHRLEDEKYELQKQVDNYDDAILKIEDMIEKLRPKPPVKMFESVTEAVKHVFQSNLDTAFTSITASDSLKKMIKKGQLELRKDQNLKHLVRSALYILSEKKGYIQKRPSDNPLVDYEYIKPFSLHGKTEILPVSNQSGKLLRQENGGNN